MQHMYLLVILINQAFIGLSTCHTLITLNQLTAFSNHNCGAYGIHGVLGGLENSSTSIRSTDPCKNDSGYVVIFKSTSYRSPKTQRHFFSHTFVGVGTLYSFLLKILFTIFEAFFCRNCDKLHNYLLFQKLHGVCWCQNESNESMYLCVHRNISNEFF